MISVDEVWERFNVETPYRNLYPQLDWPTAQITILQIAERLPYFVGTTEYKQKGSLSETDSSHLNMIFSRVIWYIDSPFSAFGAHFPKVSITWEAKMASGMVGRETEVWENLYIVFWPFSQVLYIHEGNHWAVHKFVSYIAYWCCKRHVCLLGTE